MIRIFIGSTAVASLLVACSSKPPNPNEAFAKQALQAVRDSMKDPTSVKFKDVTASAKGKCLRGDMLAKNSFGAYNGYQSFVWIDGRTFVDDPSDIDAVTAKLKASSKCFERSNFETIEEAPLDIPEA